VRRQVDAGTGSVAPEDQVQTAAHDDFAFSREPISAQEVQARFRRFLAERQLRVTRERLAILDEIFTTHHHLEVEELYQRLVAKQESVSRATLYRTLDLLVESGLVRRTRFDSDTFKYEPSYGLEHHDHMVCQRCGKVIEFVSREIERLQQLACETHDFEPRSHRLVILGTCRECRAQDD
jgi:Fur family ferric uptake transcriptional regulator